MPAQSIASRSSKLSVHQMAMSLWPATQAETACRSGMDLGQGDFGEAPRLKPRVGDLLADADGAAGDQRGIDAAFEVVLGGVGKLDAEKVCGAMANLDRGNVGQVGEEHARRGAC